MERMFAVMADNPAAAVAGFIAMACFAAGPLFRARWTMLMTYIGNNLGFALHYALLGHLTAAAMNGLMSVQTVVAILLDRKPRLRWAYYALMPVLALASVATWQGPPSYLAAAATTLSTIGRMQTNDVVLRVFLLTSTPFWAVHDLLVGSAPGLIADVLSMATGSTMLLRHSPAALACGSHLRTTWRCLERTRGTSAATSTIRRGGRRYTTRIFCRLAKKPRSMWLTRPLGISR
jgi:Bacterial inner membrane protein